MEARELSSRGVTHNIIIIVVIVIIIVCAALKKDRSSQWQHSRPSPSPTNMHYVWCYGHQCGIAL